MVYKARQLSLNRRVALKMILASELASPLTPTTECNQGEPQENAVPGGWRRVEYI